MGLDPTSSESDFHMASLCFIKFLENNNSEGYLATLLYTCVNEESEDNPSSTVARVGGVELTQEAFSVPKQRRGI